VEDIIFSFFNNYLGQTDRQTAYYCRSTEGFKRKVAPLAGAVRIATPAVIPAVIVITLSIC